MNKIEKLDKVKVISSVDELTNKNVVSIDGKEVELSEIVVKTGRITKVVKGGRRFSFNALSVIGDKDSYVGFGFGKAKEIVEAIQKSTKKAKNNIIKVKTNGTTIPFEVYGKFKSTRVLLKPCSAGTGIIAGSAVRSVLELGGIKDILTKVQGSTNPLNIVKATILALSKLITVEEAKAMRNINLTQLFGEYSFERQKQKLAQKEKGLENQEIVETLKTEEVIKETKNDKDKTASTTTEDTGINSKEINDVKDTIENKTKEIK